MARRFKAIFSERHAPRTRGGRTLSSQVSPPTAYISAPFFPSQGLGFRQGGNKTLHICYSDAVSGPVVLTLQVPIPLEVLSLCWVVCSTIQIVPATLAVICSSNSCHHVMWLLPCVAGRAVGHQLQV